MGCRNGKLAKHAGPSLTRSVRAATADKSVIASNLGFAAILSPAQIESKTPDFSASTLRFSISFTVVSPSTTPRLGRVNPKLTFLAIAPSSFKLFLLWAEDYWTGQSAAA